MKVAWLFPGQGAQSVGMCREIFDASSAARSVLAEADEALGEPISRLILEGPEDVLTLTANAQPAIVAVSCAVLDAVQDRHSLALPSFGAGHSLGEYSALVASGALRLADAVRLVRARGKAMQEAVPAGMGAMAAIMGLEPATVEGLCAQASAESGEVVSAANFNAPGQVVIAGHAAAVALASALVSDAKGKAIQLKVSAPFHCALMAPAAMVAAAHLDLIELGALTFPVVANVDALPNVSAHRVKDLLVRQVDGAVRWEESVRHKHQAGVTLALEIGPGKVLAGLLKRISKDIRVLSVGDLAALEHVPAFLLGAA